MQPLCDLLLACVQIMIAVLARDYDWGVDLREPVKKFPFPAPVWGLPMTFDRVTQTSQASPQHGTPPATPSDPKHLQP